MSADIDSPDLMIQIIAGTFGERRRRAFTVRKDEMHFLRQDVSRQRRIYQRISINNDRLSFGADYRALGSTSCGLAILYAGYSDK